MKKLQIEFQSNVDKCGIHTFKQIKRNSKVAMYQRIRLDGTSHSFEVFKIKIVKAGAPLPNGSVVPEDYEQYPGTSSFGKHAYSCMNIDRANYWYDLINKGLDEIEEAAGESENSDKKSSSKNNTEKKSSGGKRGRKPADRSKLVIPKDKFTMKHLQLANPNYSYAFLYQHIKGILNIEVKIVETISGGRGKPVLVFEKI